MGGLMATLRYEGSGYQFDFERVTAEEYREVKRKMRMTIRQILEGIGDLDVDAVTAVRWLVLRSDRLHDSLALDPSAEFDVFGFLQAWKQYEDDKTAEKEPDPTLAGSPPATPTPASTGSSTPTSESSPESTFSSSPGIAASVNGKSGSSPSPDSSDTSPASTPS
jgi:hypothetical protein